MCASYFCQSRKYAISFYPRERQESIPPLVVPLWKATMAVRENGKSDTHNYLNSYKQKLLLLGGRGKEKYERLILTASQPD